MTFLHFHCHVCCHSHSLLNLIIKAGGRIRVISFDNGRRNLCYGIERRPDGTEKVWKLSRGHWRDSKGDDSRARSSRKRIEHLSKEIEILKASPSACGDAESFLAHMVITASVRGVIMAEKLRPIWREEAFEAFQARHSAIDKFIGLIERGEPERGTGGRRQCIIVMGDGTFASNARGSRSVPTIATRRAFVIKFGADAVIDVSEHRSTKCCNGCGCVLAKLHTDLHSNFSQRRFGKKLAKKQGDFATGKTSIEPDPHQYSRRIEGMVQCTSSKERCPLFGGRIVDRDGNAARTIGDAFYAWLNGTSPPSFMEQGAHPEDVIPASISISKNCKNPLFRFLKERFPRPILDRTINRILIMLGIPILPETGITALLTGIDIPKEVFSALLAHFGPLLMVPTEEVDEDIGMNGVQYDGPEEEEEMKEEEEEEEEESSKDEETDANGYISESSASSDDDETKRKRKMRKEKAELIRHQAKVLFQELEKDVATNKGLISSSEASATSAKLSAAAAAKASASEAKLSADAADFRRALEVATEAAAMAREAAAALTAASTTAQVASDTARNTFLSGRKNILTRADAIASMFDDADRAELSTDEEGIQSPLQIVANHLNNQHISPPLNNNNNNDDGSMSDDFELASQQSLLNNTSQGHGNEAMDPVSQMSLSQMENNRVNANSVVAAITPSGALIGVGSAGSQQIVSTSVGIGHGRTGHDGERRKE
jgi:hypothetical protein